MVAQLVARILGAHHDVEITQNADVALARITNGEAFDVILCDLMMPKVTGMDLHAALVQQAPELADRMIFLTGGAFTPRARGFLDEVANQRVEKPFDPSHLRALIADRIK